MVLQQAIQHHVKLLGLKMVELNRTDGTFGSANTAAHTFRRRNLPLVVNVRKGCAVGASVNTGHSGDTLVLINFRDLGADIQMRLGKDGRRP